MPIFRKISRQTRITATAAILAAITISDSAAALGLDVITMKNGDIHNGTATLPKSNIKTVYGNISAPYFYMQKLVLGDIHGQDEIRTRFGDRFSGRITDTEITARCLS